LVLKEIQEYFQENSKVFYDNLLSHIQLSLASLLIAILICIPLGIWISRKLSIANYVIDFVNLFRVVPSLAILALAMPVLGVGFRPALLALTILACPPIIINTYIAFREIDYAIKEAAYGMGMTASQTLWKIEFPLALPVVLAGVRTASVEVIASATLAVLIGGGGLGNYITNGVSMMSQSYLLIGAVPVATLAILSEIIFAFIQKKVSYLKKVEVIK
jgi:osmoprotectant transport system permease protein